MGEKQRRLIDRQDLASCLAAEKGSAALRTELASTGSQHDFFKGIQRGLDLALQRVFEADPIIGLGMTAAITFHKPSAN